MKKQFFIYALTLGLCYNANAQMLATFEDASTDLLEKGSKWYESSLFSVEPGIGDNVDKAGLNNSDKCFIAVNKIENPGWWGNFGELKLKEPIRITNENRYLKMLAYRSVQNENLRIAINGGNGDAEEVYQGKLSNNAQWESITVDLGKKLLGQELTSIVFVYNCNWGGPSGSTEATYMFDDLQLVPAGSEFVNFDEPSYQGFSKDGNSLQDMELVDNPDKTGLNGSQKSLYLKNTTDGDWWGGVSLELPAKVLINADSKIHMMLKGEMASIELTYFFDDNSEVWGGKFEGVSDEWVDRVNDLGGQEGKMLRRIRVATFPKGWDNASINPDKELYIDEIIINTDPNPRTLSRGDNKDYSLSGTWTSNSLTSMLDNANSINLMNGNILNNGKIIPSNPNCLVYANFAAADNNCIINNEGDLTLTDGYSFHCPLEFTANNVTYTRQAWQDGNHETICIPFPLSEGWEDLKTLSSSTTSTVTFADAKDGIIANKPYIIKWPEATENKDQKQTLILKAGNVTIPVTDGLTDMMGDNAASFIGTYADKREEGIYILQSTNSFKMITAASDAEVKATPFHAYLAGQFNNSPNNVKVLFDDGGTTDLSKETLADKMLIGSGKGFITVQSACPQNVVIYTIDGKQIFNARIDEGATTISNLVQGLYILNNQKVSVK